MDTLFLNNFLTSSQILFTCRKCHDHRARVSKVLKNRLLLIYPLPLQMLYCR